MDESCQKLLALHISLLGAPIDDAHTLKPWQNGSANMHGLVGYHGHEHGKLWLLGSALA